MSKSIVFGFEGWLQGNNGVVRKMLEIVRGDPLCAEFDFKVFAHSEKITRPDHPIFLVGHSLGGESALNWARPTDIVITLDPRPNNLGSWLDTIFRYQMPFTAPEGVRVYNFYRRGFFLPGQEVKGARMNMKFGASVGHMDVPFLPEPLNTLTALLRGDLI